MKRVELVREYRLNSKKEATRACAETPTLFMEIKQPEGNFLIVPEVSSERRRYVPIGYANTEMICSNKVRYVPNATLYHFGILTSNIHMAWLRTVCGRLKSDYSYSVNIVYNNFPWPEPTAQQRQKIEQTAQAISSVCIVRPAVLLSVLRNLNPGNTVKSEISYKGSFPLRYRCLSPIKFVTEYFRYRHIQ